MNPPERPSRCTGPITGPVTVTACPDGPLIVRGPAVVIGEDGQPVERRRATVALCRCGLTGRAPWCDGGHKAGAGRRRIAGTLRGVEPS